MIENKSHSVYYLINDLCKELLSDVFFESKHNETDVRKLRLKSFEILLNKSIKKVERNVEPHNAIRNLEKEICLNRLNKVTDPKNRKKYELIEQEMQLMKSKNYFNEEPGMSVLGFLFSLEREKEKDEPQNNSSRLLIPGPFSIQVSKFDNWYPTQYTFGITPPKFFQGIQTMKDKYNLCMELLYQHPETNRFEKVNRQFEFEELKTKYDKLNESFNQAGNSIAMKIPSALKLQTNSLLQFQFKEVYIQTELEIEVPKSKPQIRCLNQNWENLQQIGIVLEKSYATETNSSYHLQEVLAKAVGKSFEAKIMPLSTFLNDVKFLCVGIQSDSFYADKNAVFYMVENITIQNISPSVICNYVCDYLECGSCYRRLKLLTVRKNFKLMFDGFIYKALCGAIDEYLLLFHEFIFAFKDTTLLSFSTRVKKMMNQIIKFTHTLGINPYNATIPALMGQNFLGFLYQKIMNIPQKDLIMLFVFILKRCCHVYFKYLHKWIFYGILEDNSNELFICFVDNYRPKTKYFYDKAYFVRKEYVPGFIQNYDNQILLCGKYTMLLKEFKSCEFTIRNPYFAILRFAVQNEDSFFDEYCACAAMYPVNCLRTGYRSVVLRNKFSEELELASLLIHISVKNKE